MNQVALKRFLDARYEKYHRPEYLRIDPLICLQNFHSAGDLEIAGLVAAALAYGRAETIISNVYKVFERTGPAIAAFAVHASLAEKQRCFEGFRHRFTDGSALALLLHGAGGMVREHGSLESCFVNGLSAGHETIKEALDCFTGQIKGSVAAKERSGVDYLLPSPSSGSACKRLNMYLRWMVRENDGIDLGVWKSVPASKLVIPVDTHVARIARSLGLTRRSTVDWKMAHEITVRLRSICRSDPARYDFSLCRSGMVNFRRNAA